MNWTGRAADAEQRMVREDWGTLCWLADASHGDLGGLTLGRVTIRPGCSAFPDTSKFSTMSESTTVFHRIGAKSLCPHWTGRMGE